MLFIGFICLAIITRVPYCKRSFRVPFLFLQSQREESGSISEIFSEVYDNKGIHGMLEWCQSTDFFTSHNPQMLVQAALDASGSNKGKAAGVLNALIGSCCTSKDEDVADYALELLEAYDELEALKPDIVTLSLAYTATVDRYPDIASEILSRAVRLHSSAKTPMTSNEPLSMDWKESIERNYGIQVLYEDDELAVVNKPSGMLLSNQEAGSHPRQRPNKHLPTLEEALLKQNIGLSNLNPDGTRGYVHRLDIGTSGCLIIAKSNAMHARLLSKFFLRQVRKSYVCLVCTRSKAGLRNIPDAGTIDLAIDQRPAKSSFTVIERYGSLAAKLKVRTSQGRKHQVRIHCSKGLQTPILLDPLYGGEQIMYHLDSSVMRDCRAQRKFCLHADALSIPDLNINVEAPVPEWWNRILTDIENRDVG